MIHGLDSLLDDYKPNEGAWDTAWDASSITDCFGTAGSVTVELTPELIEIHAAMAFAAQLMNDVLPEHFNMSNTGDEIPGIKVKTSSTSLLICRNASNICRPMHD